MSVYLAVDTGGTFTDLAVFDARNRRVQYTKSLTTHHNPIDGILTCLGKVDAEVAEAILFKHGTTLVINTLIERSGPTVALITTKGFRDALELGRGNRTETFNLFFRRDPPLVPRELRFELNERMNAQGEPLVRPSRSDVAELAERIRHLKISAVAVSFLNSYREPAHELLVAGWLREMLPGCFITAGVELSREWYEHERANTVAANAYTGPKVGGYVAFLEESLRARGFGGKVWMMGSNGGVLSTRHAAAAPVLLVESGPVGGCIGAGAYGEALGIPNLIALDMGGTTAKCALVRGGRFNVTSTYYAGGYGKGTPIRAPVIDIVEVGMGGGSIAHLDQQNRLKVGPRSAGALPGPVCYARGGTEPTVTDANLLLGRLSSQSFQGGEMVLDIEAARAAFAERLARPLGYAGNKEMLRLAAGILSIAAVQMSEAIKRVTVQCGQDPRHYALFAFGGGGPLHSVELARELSIPLVIIPPEAGNFSAIGMLLAEVRRDESRTFPRRLEEEEFSAIEAVFSEMEEGLDRSIRHDFGDVQVRFDRLAEIRFVGQYHTVRVGANAETVADLRRQFLDVYRAQYGHAMEEAAAEIVSLHSIGRAVTPKPGISDLIACGRFRESPSTRTRAVYFSHVDALLQATVYARGELAPGFSAEGPAIIEEYGSTTVIGPDDTLEIGEMGEIRIAVHHGLRGKLA
jgi:N-methylhydantoinase A